MNIISVYPSIFSKYILTNIYFCPSELPANEKLHDFMSLLNFNNTKVSGEMLGEESV